MNETDCDIGVWLFYKEIISALSLSSPSRHPSAVAICGERSIRITYPQQMIHVMPR